MKKGTHTKMYKTADDVDNLVVDWCIATRKHDSALLGKIATHQEFCEFEAARLTRAGKHVRIIEQGGQIAIEIVRAA